MKHYTKILFSLFFSFFLLTATGCREKTTAEKVKDSVEEVGEEVEEVGEEIKDEVDDATDDN